MFSPRATTTDRFRREAREHIVVNVRAGSELGAGVAARLHASGFIPVRDQEVVDVKSKNNERFFNVWEITIRDGANTANNWSE